MHVLGQQPVDLKPGGSYDKIFGIRTLVAFMLKQLLSPILVLLIVSVSFPMDFIPPGETERLRAIGSTRELPETLRRAFDPRTDFDPVPVPNPGDWLAEHPEPGQSFDDFTRSRPLRPDLVHQTIYLQPLGEFPEERSPSLETLREYATAFFGMKVQLLSPLDISRSKIRSRRNPHTGNDQILTIDILALLTKRPPKDAFCTLGITMVDLYPHPSWNFVFGQASYVDRVGVSSFARYDPAFYDVRRGRDYHEVLLRRSCKVLAHELGHMFMLAHCIYFHCIMNGSNHLHESDARPLHLCPVCLRKLQFSIGFDVVDRYQKLLYFYQRAGLENEAGWIGKQLNNITVR